MDAFVILPKMLPACVFAGLCLGATAARADVLEIDAGEAVWIAGGLANEGHAPFATTTGNELGEHAGLIPAGYAQKVAELCAKYDLSPALIEALIWQESRWRPEAVSPKGAQGLGQLMPGTARELGVDPRDPFANLEGAARYLRAQLDRFDGDIEKALAAYNAGPGRVERANGVPRIRETQNYVAAIMARLSSHSRSDY